MRWRDMTERQISELKKKQCIRCIYFSSAVSSYIGSRTCDYLTIVGHSRGCSPLECKEQGIFEPKKKGGGSDKL